MHLSTASILAVLPVLARAQWPEPESTTNGPLKGMRDPSLIRRASDGQYFLFGTNGNGTLHTATSIYGPWTQHPGGALNDAQQAVVAPQVYEVNNTYYMYYSQHDGPADQAYYMANIHVATSDSMDAGTWNEFGQLKIPANNALLANHASNNGYNILDASLLVTPENDTEPERYYLSFGSYYAGLYQTELNNPLDLQANVSVDQMNHLEVNTTGAHSTEGSFQFAWPTDGSAATKYYLFFSSGQCCKFKQMGVPAPGDEYKIMVCRADTPTGPFVDKNGKSCVTDNGGSLVLGSHGTVYAPGGQGVMYSDEVNSPVLYYHYTPQATPDSQQPDLSIGDNGDYFGWNKLAFDAQGWPTVQADNNTGTATVVGKAGGVAVQTSAARRRISYPWQLWL